MSFWATQACTVPYLSIYLIYHIYLIILIYLIYLIYLYNPSNRSYLFICLEWR
jgi:hypothetical protein